MVNGRRMKRDADHQRDDGGRDGYRTSKPSLRRAGFPNGQPAGHEGDDAGHGQAGEQSDSAGGDTSWRDYQFRGLNHS